MKSITWIGTQNNNHKHTESLTMSMQDSSTVYLQLGGVKIGISVSPFTPKKHETRANTI